MPTEYFIATPSSLISGLLKLMQSRTSEETQLAIQEIKDEGYSEYFPDSVAQEGGPVAQFHRTFKAYQEERVLSTIQVITGLNGGATELVFNLQAAYCSSLAEVAYSLRDVLDSFDRHLPDEVVIAGSTELHAWLNTGAPDGCLGTYSAPKSENCPAMSFKIYVSSYSEGGWYVVLDWTMVNEPFAQ